MKIMILNLVLMLLWYGVLADPLKAAIHLIAGTPVNSANEPLPQASVDQVY